MILIVGPETDEQVNVVSRRLAERDVPFARFDPSQFPAEVGLVLMCAADRDDVALRWRDHEVLLRSVTAAWFRSPCSSPRGDPRVIDQQHRLWLARETERCLATLWETLDCFWLPAAPSQVRRVESRLYHLRAAARLGFRVPRALLTNDPHAFLDFYRSCAGRVVSTVISDAAVRKYNEVHTIRVHTITRRDVARYLAIRFSPVIFQEDVEAALQVRATVVGQEIFAAESEMALRTDDHDGRYRPHILPSRVGDLCRGLADTLALRACDIDLLQTSTGEYIFREIRPDGRWAPIERATGMPITRAFCQLLVDGSRRTPRQL